MINNSKLTSKIEEKIYVAFSISAIALALTFFASYLSVDEESRKIMLEEDSFIEWCSAMLWLLGSIFSIIAIIIKPKAISRISYIIPVIGIAAFLDETSFLGMLSGADNPYSSGASHAPAVSPIIIAGYKFDGIHDLFSMFFKAWRDDTGLWGYAIGSIILGGLIGLSVIKRKSYMPKIMKRIREHPELNLLRMATIMVICAMVLDLNIIKSHWATFGEETLETLGGLAILFAGINMLVKKPVEKSEYSAGESSNA